MRKFLWLILLLCPIAEAQVPVALSPVPAQQFLSNTGAPLATGCVNTYITGTSTPLATYTDGTGATPNANPIILDAGGFANIWLSNASYRFVIVAYDGIPGNKCAAGVTQRTVDNVSAYTVINQAQNLFLSCGTSDPAGSAGELGCRSDLSRIRAFTTLWDTVVEETLAETLTNKTLASPAFTGAATGLNATSPLLTNPSINGVSMTNGPGVYQSIPNIGGVAPIVNSLVVLNGPPASVQLAPTSATTGVVGIWLGSSVQESGAAACNFDGGTTANDYVQISSTIAGDCHDAGGTFPTNGQVIGRVLSNQVGAGAYTMILFGPEVRANGVAAKSDLTAQAANIPNTTLITPSLNGFYRITCYSVVTQAATTSSTLPQCNLIFTDADSSVSESVNLCATSTSNLVGQICGPGSNSNALSFNAKASNVITYSTTGYTSVGATPMQYAIHVRLEGPF